MPDGKYTLRYLPLFESDLLASLDYIAVRLGNPSAAQALMEAVHAAILERLKMPTGYEPFQSLRQRPCEYYRIYVKNFVVFYVVIDDVMEVRRFLYAGRDPDLTLN